MFLGNSPHILTTWILKINCNWKTPLDYLYIKYLSAEYSCVSLCIWELGCNENISWITPPKPMVITGPDSSESCLCSIYILQITSTQILICAHPGKGNLCVFTKKNVRSMMAALTDVEHQPQKVENEKVFPFSSVYIGSRCLANTEFAKGKIVQLISMLGFHSLALPQGLLRFQGLGVWASADLIQEIRLVYVSSF